MRPPVGALFALLAACGDDAAATRFEVGVRLGELLDDRPAVVVDDATLPLEALRLVKCDDGSTWIRGFGPGERPRRLLSALISAGGLTNWNPDLRDRAFAVPIGPWCRVEVLLAGPLRVLGHTTANDAAFDLTILLPDLLFEDLRVGVLDQRVGGDGTVKRATPVPVTLEISYGGWLDPVLPALEAGDDVVVTPDDPDHDALRAAVLAPVPATTGLDLPRGPAFYRTDEPDALLTLPERAAGPLGWGAALPTGPAWP